jgi:hypothetical protein
MGARIGGEGGVRCVQGGIASRREKEAIAAQAGDGGPQDCGRKFAHPSEPAQAGRPCVGQAEFQVERDELGGGGLVERIGGVGVGLAGFGSDADRGDLPGDGEQRLGAEAGSGEKTFQKKPRGGVVVQAEKGDGPEAVEQPAVAPGPIGMCFEQFVCDGGCGPVVACRDRSLDE